MRTLIIWFFLLFSYYSQSQIYVAGDTSGRFNHYPEYIFEDINVHFDIDCDDSIDITIVSHAGGQYYNDWPSLKIYLNPGGGVIMTGTVSLYDEGDTINLKESNWFYYSWFYGLGEAGPYGFSNIDNKFTAFRKINNLDTSYFFVRATTDHTWMNIHQIISECNSDPILGTTAIPIISDDNTFKVYPNPFLNSLTITPSDMYNCSLYNIQGQMIMKWSHLKEIDTSNLPPGLYILKLETSIGKVSNVRLQKT